jgi:transcriptional regulator with XRE-family HTH domain
MPPQSHVRPMSEVLVENIKGFRDEMNWTQAELAEAMSRYGFNWTGITVAEIEGKRKRRVSLEELFGLTIVFDTALAYFLLPSLEDERRPLVEISSHINLSSTELIKLFGQNVRPSPSGQEPSQGLVADLVRLRRERDTRTRQAEEAQRNLESISTRQIEAMDQVIRQRRRIADVSEKILAIERALTETEDPSEAESVIRRQEELDAELVEKFMLSSPEALFEADRFKYLIEQVIADELDVPVADVIKMASWLWRLTAGDEVNRRLEDDPEFAAVHEDSWVAMSYRVGHELREALKREAEQTPRAEQE